MITEEENIHISAACVPKDTKTCLSTLFETLRIKGNTINRTERYAVKWAVESLQIKEINDENLELIDKWFNDLLTNDEVAKQKSTKDLMESSLKTCIKSAKRVFGMLNQNYEFVTATGNKRVRKNVKLYPPSVAVNIANNTALEDVYGKFRDYLKKCTNSDSYIYNNMYTTRSIFENLVETKVIDGSFNRSDLLYSIQCIEDKEREKIVSRNPQIKITDIKAMTLRAINIGNHMIKSKLFPNLAGCEQIDKKEINSSRQEVTHIERDYFTMEEINRLQKSYRCSKEKLIFNLFLHLGLRMKAVLSLKVGYLYDPNLVPLKMGKALEKFGKFRNFIILDEVKEALLDYKNQYGHLLSNPDNYIFPRKGLESSKYHMSETNIHRITKDVCALAGIEGDYVHTHAFRKTLVTNLIMNGNSIEKVSKYIGTTDINTTAKHYWVPTQEHLLAQMSLPLTEQDIRNTILLIDPPTTGSRGQSSLKEEELDPVIYEGEIPDTNINDNISLETEPQSDITSQSSRDEKRQSTLKPDLRNDFLVRRDLERELAKAKLLLSKIIPTLSTEQLESIKEMENLGPYNNL